MPHPLSFLRAGDAFPLSARRLNNYSQGARDVIRQKSPGFPNPAPRSQVVEAIFPIKIVDTLSVAGFYKINIGRFVPGSTDPLYDTKYEAALKNYGESCRAGHIIGVDTEYFAWRTFSTDPTTGMELYATNYAYAVRGNRMKPDQTALQETFDACDPPDEDSWIDWVTVDPCLGSSISDFSSY